MRTHTTLLLPLFYIAGLLSIGATLQGKKPSPVQRLLSGDPQEVRQAQDELLLARKHLISELINIVKDKENRIRNRASVRAAMLILGEMRAVEAIDVLVKDIGFPHVYEYTGESIPVDAEGGMVQVGIKGAQKTHPAVQPLIKIGEACLGPVLAKLALTENVDEQKACLAVLVELRHRDFVIYMLKEAINKETDTQKRDRLQNSLDLLSQIEQ